MSDETRQNRGEGRLSERGPAEGPLLRHYMAVVRRRIWVIVPVLVIVATLGILSTFRATPIYRAEARLLIEKEYPRVIGFEDALQAQAGDTGYYKTQLELLTSRPVMEQALEQPGVRSLLEGKGEGRRSSGLAAFLGEARRTAVAAFGTTPTAPPELWERLQGMVEVGQVYDTHLVSISVSDPDPRRAATLANAVADAFVQHHLERKIANTNEAFIFLQTQKDQEEAKLTAAENALQAFREQTKAVSLDVSDRDSPVFSRLRRLNEQLTETQLKRIELEARASVVRAAIGDGERPIGDAALNLPEVQSDAAIAALRVQMLQARKNSAALFDTYGPEHPQYRAARQQLDMLEDQLQAALPRVAGTIKEQLAVLRNQEDELRAQYESQTEAALELSGQSLAYDRLASDVARRRKLFDVLVERLREVDLTADYAKTNVEVAEPADVPRIPVSPRKARGVVLSLFLGLLLGVGFAFLIDHMDDTVKTPEDLEDKAGIATLGFVPAINGRKGSRDGAFEERARISIAEPTSSVAEAYRSIRTSLFFSAPAEQARVVVVTSANRGDGKTTTAANLGVVMAQSGKRVLLIDADCRRPRMHSVFGLSGKVGLSSVLVGQSSFEEAVRQPSDGGDQPIENLHVLPTGPLPPNPAELLGSPQMRDLLDKVGRQYDRVLIDSPPVLFVADASILGALCDGVLLVVKSARNTGTLARRARRQLDGVNAHILGAVLNDVHVARLGPYYSEYYQYGYSHYYRDHAGSSPDGDGESES